MTSSLSSSSSTASSDAALAWFFVIVWGSGYLASKIGMQYAPPFTFLTLRFSLGILCLIPWLLISRPSWPSDRREFFHICIAGLLMHAINLGGSHYSQYLGMSAGITALMLATQPLFTAIFAHFMMHQRLALLQWGGVLLGLSGVALVVWHKIDVNAIAIPSLIAVAISLFAITSGTLYQRAFCKSTDLRSSALIQFALSLLVLIPLAWQVEGFSMRWDWKIAAATMYLVIFSSILAVNALHVLMRRGHAAKVTSLLFLTPVVAVILEWLMFGVVPTALSIIGIATTYAGVALVTGRCS